MIAQCLALVAHRSVAFSSGVSLLYFRWGSRLKEVLYKGLIGTSGGVGISVSQSNNMLAHCEPAV